MLLNGKNVCDGMNGKCLRCFTCGNPKKVLMRGNQRLELCTKCYEIEKNK